MRALPLFALFVFIPALAFASELDPTTGRLDLSDATIALGFDGAAPPAGVVVHHFGANVTSMTPEEQAALVDREDSIEDDGSLLMGGNASPLMLVETEGLRDRLGDRRVEVRLWYRAEGTRPRAFVIWLSGDVATSVPVPDFSQLQDIGLLPLLPSGRATDDGWVELTSGPFDFLLAHRIAPLLFVDDELRLEQPPFVANQEGRVRVDALAIYDRGEAVAPDSACTLADEDATCGAAGLCTLGRCADAAVVDGPAFAEDRLRDEYVARRRFERRMFSGHRAARANLDRYDAEVDRIVASPNKRFWSRLRLAVDHLEDGHASGPSVNPLSGIGGGACLIQSQADLLPTLATLPMVFRSDATHPLGAVVRRGDVLTHVDGLETPAWRSLAEPYLNYPADGRGRAFVTTQQLLGVAFRKGSTLSFARCGRTDGVACSEGELERFEVRTSTMTAAFWSDEPPAWRASAVPCDARFTRPAGDFGITQTTHVATASIAGVRVLQINGTPGTSNAWFMGTAAAFNPAPERMLLDERRGDGGSLGSVHWISAFFFPGGVYPANIVVPPLASFEDDVALRQAMFDCSIDTGSPGFGYFICGGVLVSNYAFLNGQHPATNAAAETKLAILTGIDASGNDWLTYNLRTLRPPGRTRVFGPVPLFGAYGELAILPLHRVGFAGGSFQMTGGVILGAEGDPVDVHVGGRGVEPDVVVLQRQSDALQGIDTQVEAAMRWLEEER